ncbi:hypothetical protein TRIUR3_20959 [Triticum urartu]|uniref:Uncharacterized protein n=1 Tax=Triticum urartu TaxID=4572 RepID=M7ZT02_TRIUA|nr:hypothetical protein TRIUR3_20959 [Triticum urartu]
MKQRRFSLFVSQLGDARSKRRRRGEGKREGTPWTCNISVIEADNAHIIDNKFFRSSASSRLLRQLCNPTGIGWDNFIAEFLGDKNPLPVDS